MENLWLFCLNFCLSLFWSLIQKFCFWKKIEGKFLNFSFMTVSFIFKMWSVSDRRILWKIHILWFIFWQFCSPLSDDIDFYIYSDSRCIQTLTHRVCLGKNQWRHLEKITFLYGSFCLWKLNRAIDLIETVPSIWLNRYGFVEPVKSFGLNGDNWLHRLNQSVNLPG